MTVQAGSEQWAVRSPGSGSVAGPRAHKGVTAVLSRRGPDSGTEARGSCRGPGPSSTISLLGSCCSVGRSISKSCSPFFQHRSGAFFLPRQQSQLRISRSNCASRAGALQAQWGGLSGCDGPFRRWGQPGKLGQVVWQTQKSKKMQVS